MEHDGDFAAYLAARWPTVVRTLVLLGCPDDQAEDVGRTAFARCYPVWGRIRRDDDIDADVYRAVLDAWARRRGRHHHEVTGPAEVRPAPTGTDLRGPVLLSRTFAAQLDTLAPDLRQVLVLRFVAELSDEQVADLLDESADAVRLLVREGLSAMDLVLLGRVAGEALGDPWRVENPQPRTCSARRARGSPYPRRRSRRP